MTLSASPGPGPTAGTAGPPPPSRWDVRLASLLVGLGLGLLHSSPFLPVALSRGLDWPVHLVGEAASLSTYGKWWVLPPHRVLVDAFSGDFPVFYNYVSDALLNALAALGGWPPMTVQAVLYGPFLSACFFWANAASLAAVAGDRRVGLVGALLLSLTGGSGLAGLASRHEADLVRTLHVPFHSLSLGTGQSLGWVFMLPCLALLHLARQRFTPGRAVAFGLVTGLLVHVHTLTFVNAALAQLAYLMLATIRERPPRLRVWVGGVVLVAAGLVVRAAHGPLSFTVLAAFGLATLALNLAFDRDRRLYLWGYGTAAMVALPYVLALARHPAGLVRVAQSGSAIAVAPADVALFFAPHLLAALLACRAGAPTTVLVFFSSFFVATAGLAVNHLWNWGNHPYRFAINLLFPLAGLGAWGLVHGARWPARLLSAWLSALAAVNVIGFVRGPRAFAEAAIAPPEVARFLDGVRTATAATPPGARVLNSPEFDYPQGVTQNAVLLNYSRRPGFLPDYRYLLDRERYFNRLGLFCFLFPRFPAHDAHTGRRACEEPLEPPADVVAIREPRLRSCILPVYRIALVASSGPLGGLLDGGALAYGWTRIEQAGPRRQLMRVDPPHLPGLALLRPGREGPQGLALAFDVERRGPHVAVLGGRFLGQRVTRILVDGRLPVEERRRGNWAVLRASLEPGRHELLLERAGRDTEGETDVLYFTAVVHEEHVRSYLELPALGARPLR